MRLTMGWDCPFLVDHFGSSWVSQFVKHVWHWKFGLVLTGSLRSWGHPNLNKSKNSVTQEHSGILERISGSLKNTQFIKTTLEWQKEGYEMSFPKVLGVLWIENCFQDSVSVVGSNFFKIFRNSERNSISIWGRPHQKWRWLWVSKLNQSGHQSG